MKEFTFGICTYNSSDYILQTLESVKYQVVNYGKDIKSTLLIADDCSSDDTIDLVRGWLEKNSSLFWNYRIIEHEKNYGIAFNYSKLLEEIKTDCFKTIDGDDIISSYNIYKQIASCDDNTLTIFMPSRFNEKGMFYLHNECMDMLYYSKAEHSHARDLRMLEAIKPFITPEVCYRRRLYTDKTSEFIRQYTQFEDDTSLYQIFKSHKGLKMRFILEPMILYRVHRSSLSNGVESLAQIRFIDDLHKYKKRVLQDETNLIMKMFLLLAVIDTFRMKHRFSTKRSLFKWFANRMSLHRSKIAKKYNEYGTFINMLDEFEKSENEHLKIIEKNAEDVLTEINEKNMERRK